MSEPCPVLPCPPQYPVRDRGSIHTCRSYPYAVDIWLYYETARVAPRYRNLELWSDCIDRSRANASRRCNNLHRQKALNNELPDERAQMI